MLSYFRGQVGTTLAKRDTTLSEDLPFVFLGSLVVCG